MPTLVNETGKSTADGDVAMADVATPPPPSTGKSVSKSSKRRTTSPTPDANSTNQAIAAANLAAAVQMAASLQLNGLLSLLTQSSTPGAASAADPTVLQTNLPAPKSNAAWQVPSAEQVRQASLKMASDIPPFVHLSKTDSAPQLKILDDRLTLKGGMRGYRMSRATHGVSQGYYYFEVLVLEPPTIQEIVNSLPPNARLGTTLQKQIQQALEYDKRQRHAAKKKSPPDQPPKAPPQEEQKPGPGRKRKAETEMPQDPSPPQVGGHLRIGWSMRTGDLQAPVGYDKWSYGFRNLMGSKIHQSRREDSWGGEPWGPGDVVGCAIFLNPTTANTVPSAAAAGTNTTTTAATNAATNNPATSAGNSPNNGNQIRFFKNGAPMGHFVISKGKREGGAAFEDIQPGTYYPAISSYLGGSVQVNFGPHFVHPPRKLPHGMSGKLQPISSLQAAPLTEQELLARLKRKNFFAKVGKETPEMKMAGFREAVLAESKVLQEAYKQHRRKHLKQVLEARQARNLNTADLQQELDELEGKEGKSGDGADREKTEKKAEEEPQPAAKEAAEKPASEKPASKDEANMDKMET